MKDQRSRYGSARYKLPGEMGEKNKPQQNVSINFICLRKNARQNCKNSWRYLLVTFIHLRPITLHTPNS